MNRLLKLALVFSITCAGCTHVPPGNATTGQTVGEILKTENVPLEKCLPGDEPAGSFSKLTYFSPRTRQVVTLHTTPYTLGDPISWAPLDLKVLAITRTDPVVAILTVDENGSPISGATVRQDNDQILGTTDILGVFRMAVHDNEMVKVSVTEESNERGDAYFSPLQGQAVVVLHSKDPMEWSNAMDSIRCGMGQDLHGAYGFFVYHGCKDAVPFLIDRLERERPAEGQTRVICTAVHCLEALQMQTGKDFRWDVQAWRQWWETEGKGLPESHFNARRRCEERERRWKQQHAAHAKEPLPESVDQKAEESAPPAP